MSKWYGNVTNRIEEGRLLEPVEGMDITMYYWSDRTCYYITKVDNPKRIHVKKYEVCADHDKAGGMGHQNWLYFKTRAEMEDYLKKFFPDREEYKFEEPGEDIWVYRYRQWMQEVTYTEDNYCNEAEKKSLEKNGYYKRYYKLSGKVSFGVRDYYYDWEF